MKFFQRGDLFSLQFDYEKITLLVENFPQALSIEPMCKVVDRDNFKLEGFQDNFGTMIKDMGNIFCDTMNAKMAEFPETHNQMVEVEKFAIDMLANTNLDSIDIPVNGKSFSVEYQSPNVGSTQTYLEIHEMGSDRQIYPREKVLDKFSTVVNSFQSKEEICYIMTTRKDESMNVKSMISTDMCNRLGDWWTVCKFEKKISIKLKGLCSLSSVDTDFFLAEPVKGSLDRYGTFGGVSGWKIEYDQGEKTWKIHHSHHPHNTIKLTSSSRRPFGKKIWSVEQYTCAQGDTVPLLLQLSNCGADDYTCDDGSCVPLVKRCDKVPDCKDVSDEKQCKVVAIDKDRYIRDDTPPPLIKAEKLEVTLGLNIQNILDIKEVDNIFTLKFDMEAFWKDSRLQFYNLKEDMEMNSLIFQEKSDIWVPTIIFSNTREDLTSQNDEKAFIKVIRNNEENGTLIGSDINDDILVFRGLHHQLKINRVYEVEFICNYDMRFYPFDIQECTLDLVVDDNTAKFLSLQPGDLVSTGSSSFAQYYVLSYQIYSSQVRDKDGIKVSVILGRRLLGVFLTAYTPTILLNIIGHSTNYFKSFFFEAVVTVNLTCMLVLATMFISISNDLPKTAYLKMMDYWLVFTLLLPFLEVLLHTYMEKQNEDDDHKHDGDDADTDTVHPFDSKLPKVDKF